MEILLTPSWTLTTEHAASTDGQPVLVNRVRQTVYLPGEIVKTYSSYGFLSAAEAVRRMVQTAHRSKADMRLVERFCGLAGVPGI